MSKEIDAHTKSIDQARLTATLLSLLTVQSYPGSERECAEMYASQLEAAGMEVELDAAYSGSPSVIARLTGGPGPVLQFVGHLDTVPVEHPAPYLRNNIVFGQGSCDMKAGLAAFAETAAILATSRGSLRGSLLITAYGQHEGSTTGTMHEPLRDLMRRGIRGDAIIVGDCTDGYAPTKGKGALIFDLTFSRNGTTEHELFGRQNVGHPLNAACRFVEAMTERSSSWPIKDAELGNETFFVGSLQGGEMYNTVPTAARVQGTQCRVA